MDFIIDTSTTGIYNNITNGLYDNIVYNSILLSNTINTSNYASNISNIIITNNSNFTLGTALNTSNYASNISNILKTNIDANNTATNTAIGNTSNYSLNISNILKTNIDANNTATNTAIGNTSNYSLNISNILKTNIDANNTATNTAIGNTSNYASNISNIIITNNSNFTLGTSLNTSNYASNISNILKTNIDANNTATNTAIGNTSNYSLNISNILKTNIDANNTATNTAIGNTSNYSLNISNILKTNIDANNTATNTAIGNTSNYASNISNIIITNNSNFTLGTSLNTSNYASNISNIIITNNSNFTLGTSLNTSNYASNISNILKTNIDANNTATNTAIGNTSNYSLNISNILKTNIDANNTATNTAIGNTSNYSLNISNILKTNIDANNTATNTAIGNTSNYASNISNIIITNNSNFTLGTSLNTSNYASNISNILLININDNISNLYSTDINVYTPVRQYPSKAYNTITNETTTTFLTKTVYTRNFTLDTTGITYGSGVYTMYISSTYSASGPYLTHLLFDYNVDVNGTGAHFQSSTYDATGVYNGTNGIITGYNGEWVILKLPNPIFFTKLEIISRNGYISRAPAEWKCYGSNDGNTFTEITTASQMTRLLTGDYVNNAYTKSFNNLISYLYIGFTFNKIVGDGPILNIIELKLFGQERIQPYYVSSNVLTTYLNNYYNQTQTNTLITNTSNYSLNISNILKTNIDANDKITSNSLYGTAYTIERQYPPKTYNTSVSQSIITYLSQNSIYYETINLNTDGISYGSGNYEIYSSSIDNTIINFTGTGNTLNNVTNDTNYSYISFINSGTLSLSSNLICDILIVGGGGSGGQVLGGGGGGGAVIYITNANINAGTYNIVVGAGGAQSSTTLGNKGNNSSFAGIIAEGGGTSANYCNNGGSGGSGGGASADEIGITDPIGGSVGTQSTLNGFTGNIYGNKGGDGLTRSSTSAGYMGGGGGGGAGEVGQNGNPNNNGAGGRGGNGVQINITGTNLYWGAGGGGAQYVSSDGGVISRGGNGGLGGGGGGASAANYIGSGGTGGLNNGSAANTSQQGGAGGANTGSGGGSGAWVSGSPVGGAGGSGIVIIRFLKTSKKELFNYITNETGSQYQRSNYNSTTGNYNVNTNYIKTGYFGDFLVIKLPAPIMLTKFQIHSRIGFKERAPSLWKFYGSNDNSNWEEIIEASMTTALTLSNYSLDYYEKIVINQIKNYSYFGIVVSKIIGNNANADTLNFTELKLFGRDIIPFSPNYLKLSGGIMYGDINGITTLNASNITTQQLYINSPTSTASIFFNPSSPSYSIFKTKVPWAMYFAEDYNPLYPTILPNYINNGRDATLAGTITKSTASGNGATGAITYISGTINSTLLFPAGSIPTTFTILSLTRYNGTNKKRILDGSLPYSYYWFHGHWDNKRGKAYYNMWITDSISSEGNIDDWLCMIGKNSGGLSGGNILVDGIAKSTTIGGAGGNNSILNINIAITNEKSDWALSCVMIWDTALSDAEMLELNTIINTYKNNGVSIKSLIVDDTIIETRPYNGTEKTELLLFKGNDIAGTRGEDRIRLKAGSIAFDTYTELTPAINRGNENIVMFINGTGNVGIGTTNPLSKLHIQHSSTSLNTSNGGLYVYNPNNTANSSSVIGTRIGGTSANKAGISLDVLSTYGWSIYISGTDTTDKCLRFNSSSDTSGIDRLQIRGIDGKTTIYGNLLHIKGNADTINTVLTIMGKGGQNAISQINLATYDNGGNNPVCSLLATDCGNFTSLFEIKQKLTTAIDGPVVSTFTINSNGLCTITCNLNVSGICSATTFSGSGASLTNLDYNNITINKPDLTLYNGWTKSGNDIYNTSLTNGNVGIGLTNPTNMLKIYNPLYTRPLLVIDAGIENLPRNQNPRAIGKPLIGLGNRAWTDIGDYYGIGFGWHAGRDSDCYCCEIGLIITNTNNGEYGDLVFSTRSTNGNFTPATERMRITSTGNLALGSNINNTTYKLNVNGSINSTSLYQNGTLIDFSSYATNTNLTNNYLALSGGTMTGTLTVPNITLGSNGKINSYDDNHYIQISQPTDTLTIQEYGTISFNIGPTKTQKAFINSTGLTVSGICSATTFSGSGASLTNIPYASITGKPTNFQADWLSTVINIPSTFPADMANIYTKTETNNLLSQKEASLTFNAPLTRTTNTIGINLTSYSTTGNDTNYVLKAGDTISGTLSFSSAGQDFLIYLYGTSYGFGINADTLRYNAGVNGTHKFYTEGTLTASISKTGLITAAGGFSGSGASLTNIPYASITGKPTNFQADWLSTVINIPSTFPADMANIYTKTEIDTFNLNLQDLNIYDIGERQYPPKVYDSSTGETTNTAELTNIVPTTYYKGSFQISAYANGYGIGTYVVYTSSFYGNGGERRQLFDYNLTDGASHWNQSSYSQGNYIGSSYIQDINYKGDWIILKLPYPIILNRFRFYNRTGSEGRSPGLWKCWGSMNGLSFVEITEASNTITKATYTSNYYEKILVSTFTTPYRYIGFTINKLVGTTLSSDYILNFSEIQLFAKPFYINSNVLKSTLTNYLLKTGDTMTGQLQLLPTTSINPLLIYSTSTNSINNIEMKNNANNSCYIGIGGTGYTGNYINNLFIQSPNALILNTNGNGTSSTPNFIINSSGNVNIGSLTDFSTGTKLQIKGASYGYSQPLVRIQQTAGWDGNYCLQTLGYTDLGGIRINGADLGNTIYKSDAGTMGLSTTNGDIIIFTNGGERARFNSAGNTSILGTLTAPNITLGNGGKINVVDDYHYIQISQATDTITIQEWGTISFNIGQTKSQKAYINSGGMGVNGSLNVSGLTRLTQIFNYGETLTYTADFTGSSGWFWTTNHYWNGYGTASYLTIAITCSGISNVYWYGRAFLSGSGGLYNVICDFRTPDNNNANTITVANWWSSNGWNALRITIQNAVYGGDFNIKVSG